MSPPKKVDPLVQLLADTRRELGLTQYEMAGWLEVSQSSISEWETGVVQPELASIRRMLGELGFDIVAIPVIRPR